MPGKYIISLDQGTTSSRTIIFDKKQNIVSKCQQEYTQIYPKPGWVEHNPLDIFNSQFSTTIEAMLQAEILPNEIAAIGITNQRETTIIWDKITGIPIYNAIVWQCRRTAEMCEELKKDTDFAEYIRLNTGLLIDAYFSATKIKWILDNVDGAREKAENGNLLFGTVDTWLVWKLTNGKVHITDCTNASRTMLFNIHDLKWDKHILNKLGIPECMLPKVKNSSEIYGYTDMLGSNIPIAGIAGDQQAALFGQLCFDKGDVKNTYGTGNFILMNTGSTPVISKNGLITTIACSINEEVTYALEGSVFVGGAVIQWLRDEMRFFSSAKDADYLGSKLMCSEGVYFVPSFTGMGAPHWDMYARGSIFGLTRGTTREHIIRAALEAIAFQSMDVINAMAVDTDNDINIIKVDGGSSASELIMQFQSDITGKTLVKPVIAETTALGAAFLAGLAVGFWKSKDELKSSWTLDKTYNPIMEKNESDNLIRGWNKAVYCTKLFSEQ
ncbi:MAG: glycerol kinase GlpK [Candidatus Metalachnospira sp.]|nr:glycerol kinase GlpK [Candidatus Metalachnospira sp.]